MTQSQPLSAQDFLPLEADDIHIWPLSLDLPEAELRRLEGVISAEETAFAKRFAFPSDRSRYVAAHGLLRLVLAATWTRFQPPSHSAETPTEASAGASRAPTFQSVPLWSPRALGCERQAGGWRRRREIRDIDNIEDLAKTCFSPPNRPPLLQCPPSSARGRSSPAGRARKPSSRRLATDCRGPLDSFTVSLAPAEPAKLLRVEGAPRTSESYAIRSLEPAPGYLGALAVDGPEVRVLWRWV